MAGIGVITVENQTRQLTPRSTAPVFSSSTSYAVGDLVYNDGTLYKCTTAHNGVWNASHFTAVTISGELQAKEAEIENVKSDLSQYQTSVVPCESGTYTRAEKTDNIARIRNKRPVSISGIDSITIPNGYEAWVFKLNANCEYIGAYSAWVKETAVINDITDAQTYYLNFGFRLIDNPTADISGNIETVSNGIVLNRSVVDSGLSDEAKVALLECFRHTAFLDHDNDYYTALKNALYPDDIASLIATFNQDGYMFSPTDELDDLLPFLTVKAQYNDGTEKIITGYSLSGSLDYAISTITVTYLEKTTTFNVTVKQLPSGYTRKTYIESDRSQYISTNISEVEAGGYSYKFKAMPSDPTPTGRLIMHVFSSLSYYAAVFRHGGSSASAPEPNRYISSNRWGNEAVLSENQNLWSVNTISTIKAYLNGDDNVYADDTLANTCQIGTTKDASNKMFLLGYSDGPARSDFRYAGRIYYFKMYAIGTNTKAHDFVPCINSQSVAGVYDLVTDEFLSPTVGTLVTD